MRAGIGTESTQYRGNETTRIDWVYPVCRGGNGDGCLSQAKSSGSFTWGSNGGDEGDVGKASGTTSVVDVDTVNHPPHYTTDGKIECIEAIEAQLTTEEYRGYLKGNIAKYIWRERHKGGVESQKKAEWYLKRLIKLCES